MAYRGRGGSIKGGLKSGGGNPKVRMGVRPIIHIYYGDYLLSEIISLILIGIIVIIGILALIFNYESQYIFDPIEKVKNNFIELQFLGLILNIIFMIIATAKRKNSKNAYKMFGCVFLTLLSVILITSVGYINFINKYDENAFREMYTESAMKIEVNNESKELFINECKNLNDKFTIKVITICITEYMLIFINLILFISALKSRNEYKKIEEENEVLFDEEINVKF